MIKIKKIYFKLWVRILLKGDILKRIDFYEIFMVGIGKFLLIEC